MWLPSLQSHSSMCIPYQYKCQDAIGQKKAVIHSLAITRDKDGIETERRELRSGQLVQYLNNMSHGQNPSFTSQVNQEAEPSPLYFLKTALESSMGRHKAFQPPELCRTYLQSPCAVMHLQNDHVEPSSLVLDQNKLSPLLKVAVY
jgi:hypothetical protein